jgi:hypothetical protein
MRYSTSDMVQQTCDTRHPIWYSRHATLDIRYGTADMRYSTSDMLQQTCDTRHPIWYSRHATLDIRYGTADMRYSTSDMVQQTCDTRHPIWYSRHATLDIRYGTADMRYSTSDMVQQTCDTRHPIKRFFRAPGLLSWTCIRPMFSCAVRLVRAQSHCHRYSCNYCFKRWNVHCTIYSTHWLNHKRIAYIRLGILLFNTLLYGTLTFTAFQERITVVNWKRPECIRAMCNSALQCMEYCLHRWIKLQHRIRGLETACTYACYVSNIHFSKEHSLGNPTWRN